MVIGSGIFLCGFSVDSRTKEQKNKGKGEPDGKPCSDYQMIWTRDPDLPKGSGKRRFGGVATQIDPASEQHVPNPAIAAPRLLWLSTGGCTVDLAKKANPCLRIEEHKQEQGRMQTKFADV